MNAFYLEHRATSVNGHADSFYFYWILLGSALNWVGADCNGHDQAAARVSSFETIWPRANQPRTIGIPGHILNKTLPLEAIGLPMFAATIHCQGPAFYLLLPRPTS